MQWDHGTDLHTFLRGLLIATFLRGILIAAVPLEAVFSQASSLEGIVSAEAHDSGFVVEHVSKGDQGHACDQRSPLSCLNGAEDGGVHMAMVMIHLQRTMVVVNTKRSRSYPRGSNLEALQGHLRGIKG